MDNYSDTMSYTQSAANVSLSSVMVDHSPPSSPLLVEQDQQEGKLREVVLTLLVGTCDIFLTERKCD